MASVTVIGHTGSLLYLVCEVSSSLLQMPTLNMHNNVNFYYNGKLLTGERRQQQKHYDV